MAEDQLSLQPTKRQRELDGESEGPEPMESTQLFPDAEDQQLTSYQEDSILREILNESGITTLSPSDYSPSFIRRNFILLSILFSANHGAVVSCLSLATARLGNLGNYQSSVLYLSYTLSALFGATYVVKTVGARNSIMIGMIIYCAYVGCFVIATLSTSEGIQEASALCGALIGGIGGGFLWTAQGSYFATASEEYALAKSLEMEESTSILGGLFAGIYLGEEVLMRLVSTIMLHFGWSWRAVFSGYFIVAMIAAVLMMNVVDYPSSEEDQRRNRSQSLFYKSTVTFRLLISDPKMKYMIPLSSAFALSSVFMVTFVNAEVLRTALDDVNSTYVGLLTSITSIVGGVMSVFFGYSSKSIGNQSILFLGCLSFFIISYLFLVNPNIKIWTLPSIIFIYALQGVGRATFEGTLKAEFANVFHRNKEAAFGNIVFQNGLTTTVGFMIAASDGACHGVSKYCIGFHDGKVHNVLIMEVLVMIFSILAIAGYKRAKYLHEKEQEEHELESRLLGEDNLL